MSASPIERMIDQACGFDGTDVTASSLATSLNVRVLYRQHFETPRERYRRLSNGCAEWARAFGEIGNDRSCAEMAEAADVFAEFAATPTGGRPT